MSCVHRVVEARVPEGRVPLVRVEDRTEDRPTPDQEAKIGGEPWECGEDEHDRGDDAYTVAAQACARAEPAAAGHDDGQRERQHDARRGNGVDPLRVEVGLIDHARPEDSRAQDDRDDREPVDGPATCLRRDDRHERDRGKRDGEVEEDRGSTAARYPADPAHVVELVDVQARVRREDLRRDQGEDRPERPDLTQTRTSAVAEGRHGR